MNDDTIGVGVREQSRDPLFLKPEPFGAADYFFKASPHTEGDRRFVYCEPSNENLDVQDERTLQTALQRSAAHFLRFGNLDVGHLTFLGLQLKIQHPELYEIGRPVDVTFDPTLVKGEIYRGDGPTAEQANLFWASLTEQKPPQQWYPSVGGRTFAKSCQPDGTCDILAVAWENIGFWKIPVNQTVRPVSVMPMGVFAKALLAGYGTDSSTFIGGRALQAESLDAPKRLPAYQPIAGRFLKALGTSRCQHSGYPPTLVKAVAHFRQCEGLGEDLAKSFAHRLIRDAAKQMSVARAA